MATQTQHLQWAVGEDVSDTLTMYGPDGVTTVSIAGRSLTFTASLPGGAPVITFSTAAGSMTAGLPQVCNALIFSASSITLNIPPGYFDFQIRTVDVGANTETTVGTLVLTP
jgi:hypothetical protein